MNALDLIERLESLGIRIVIHDGRLRVNAARGQLSEDLKAAIFAQKSELMAVLGARPQNQYPVGNVIPKDAAPDGEFPLSFAQRRLWFLSRLEPGNKAYSLPASFVIDDTVEMDSLEQAINDVLRRQESLRTVFREVDGDPVQVVQPFRPISLDVIDLAHLPGDARVTEADRLVRAEAAAPFDLVAGPLFRVRLVTLETRRHLLLFTMHHIIADNWSLGIFVAELKECYEARRAGSTPRLAPLATQYRSYAAEERTRLAGPELERLIGYWRTRLSGAPPTLDLPTDRPRPPRQTFNGAVLGYGFSGELSDALRMLARRERASLYMTLLAVINVVLHRYTGQTDIVLGTAIANRRTPELERLIGLFASTIPIRSELDGDPSIRTLIARTRDIVLEAQAHQDLPFEKLVEELRPERTMAWSPIFQVAFVLQNTPLSSTFVANAAAPIFDLTLYSWDGPNGIHGGIEYNADLFDGTTIERMAGHLQALAESAVVNPELPISRLSMLSAVDRKTLLDDWNSTESEYPRDATITELFDAIAEQRPESIAVESADASRELPSCSRLTYAGLADATSRLAAQLRARGVHAGMSVGLYMERSVGAVIAMLALLRGGSAYVPLDTGEPTTRTVEVLRDAGVRFVLAARTLAARLPQGEFEVLVLEDEWQACQALTKSAAIAEGQAGSLAYVMFTSGTTGKPKGVCVTHRNIVRLVRNTNYLRFGPDEVILQLAPLAFDASTFEIWGALLNGGRLVLLPGRVPAAGELAQALEKYGITILWLTAGFFHYMVENEVAALARVRQVLAGGDVLSATHVQRLLDAKRDGAVINGYGPTENTTFTCCHVMNPGVRIGDTVPIGRPIANTRVYILDQYGELAPIGIAGELFAGGDGVARGYVGDPIASAGKFVADPFDPRPGAMMYRTGDLARWRADGTIEFLGRRDRQVKIRGFRVELGEIENALRAVPSISDAAVVARRDASGTTALVGYIVPPTGASIDLVDVRRGLATCLPDYMVPGAFVVLAALPLTPNGKLDRAALPEPTSTTVANVLADPHTILETQLHAIWAQVLGRSGIGIHDNFFDLGGHSLLALRLFSQIESVIGQRLPLSVLFQAPTVAQLAARLEHEGFGSPWSSLVAIQPKGTKPPLFLVPGVGGNVVCYESLARLLGADQPVYGLQSRGLDGRERPFDRLEPMAEHYIHEIRRVQSTGPYYLGGTCFGGVVAYEMAQQLRSVGEEVSFLLLLESWPPPRGLSILGSARLYSQHARHLLSAAKRHLKELVAVSPRRLIPALRGRLKIVREIVQQGDVYRGDKAAMYLDRVSTTNFRALVKYRLRPYDGKVLLVRASERQFRGDDTRRLWRELALAGYSEFEIPVIDSGRQLISPNVEVLAPWVLKHLEAARRDPERGDA